MDRLVWLLMDLAAWWDSDVWTRERGEQRMTFRSSDGCPKCGHGRYFKVLDEPFKWMDFSHDGWRPQRYV